MSLLTTLLPSAFYAVCTVGLLAVWAAERRRKAEDLKAMTVSRDTFKAWFLEEAKARSKAIRKHLRCHDLYVEARGHLATLQEDHEAFLHTVYASHDRAFQDAAIQYGAVKVRIEGQLATAGTALAMTTTALEDARQRARKAEAEVAVLKSELSTLADIERPLWLKGNADLHLKVEGLEGKIADLTTTLSATRRDNDQLTARNKAQSESLAGYTKELAKVSLELDLMRENVKAMATGNRMDGRRGYHCTFSNRTEIGDVRYLALEVATADQRATLVTALAAFFGHHVADPYGAFNTTEGLKWAASLGGKLNRMVQVERKRQQALAESAARSDDANF